MKPRKFGLNIRGLGLFATFEVKIMVAMLRYFKFLSKLKCGRREGK